MIEVMRDRGEKLESVAHQIEQPAKSGSRPPMLSLIMQRMLPAYSRFPTDHLPEGSH